MNNKLIFRSMRYLRMTVVLPAILLVFSCENDEDELEKLPEESAEIEVVQPVKLTNVNLYENLEDIDVSNVVKLEVIESFIQATSRAAPLKLSIGEELLRSDSILEIKLQNDTRLTLAGSNKQGEYKKHFRYLGYSAFFNSYFIRGEFYEGRTTFMCKADDGEIIRYFESVPYLTPDKKHLLSLINDDHGDCTKMEYVEIGKNNELEDLIKVCFTNWKIHPLEMQQLWIADNALVLKAKPMIGFWKNYKGAEDKDFEYLLVSLLNAEEF